jgi:hypothetical protein
VDDAGRRKQWVFVVRVWLEPVSSGPPSLRGSVRDVASGAAAHFTSPKDLADFIALRGIVTDDRGEP